MRALFLLLALLFSSLPAVAQSATAPAAEAATTSDADIATLVRILENADSRALLIERLQQTAGGETPIETVEARDLSIARQLAEYTRAVAEGTSRTLQELGQLSMDVGQGIAGAGNADFDALRDAAIGVVLTGVALIASFLVLRLAVRWLQGKIAGRVAAGAGCCASPGPLAGRPSMVHRCCWRGARAMCWLSM